MPTPGLDSQVTSINKAAFLLWKGSQSRVDRYWSQLMKVQGPWKSLSATVLSSHFDMAYFYYFLTLLATFTGMLSPFQKLFGVPPRSSQITLNFPRVHQVSPQCTIIVSFSRLEASVRAATDIHPLVLSLQHASESQQHRRHSKMFSEWMAVHIHIGVCCYVHAGK